MKLDNKKIPQKCGIYFFRDKRGLVLYIGKAINLKNRLASYLKSQLGGRTAKLMEKAARVNWQGTNSEIEALILESQLIKKHRPPFNIMLRDDKQYFYVGFTDEQFPKVFLSHQIQNTKYKLLNTKFLGPFTDGAALKATLRLLRRIFPYCTCKQKHNNYCLNYHIGKCPGFCCSRFALREAQLANRGSSISQSNSRGIWEKSGLKKPEFRMINYKKNIKALKDILIGRRTDLIKKLKNEMAGLGKSMILKKLLDSATKSKN